MLDSISFIYLNIRVTFVIPHPKGDLEETLCLQIYAYRSNRSIIMVLVSIIIVWVYSSQVEICLN